MPTSRLSTALEQLLARGKPGERVFARERALGGSQTREYCVMSPGAAWRETCTKTQPHLYEVLSHPCNMYLDVEWKCDSPPPGEKARLREIINVTLERLEEVYNVTDVAVHTANASGWVGDKYKCSWHVHMVCKEVCWSNAACVGDFVRKHLSDVSEVDKVPYHAPKQNWRCIGSSKASDPKRAFTPIDKTTFMNCLVGCKVGNRRMLGAELARKRSVEPASPPHVITLANSLGEMRTDSMLQMGHRYWCVPFMKRIHCTIANRTHTSNHQYAIIDLWGMRWRQKCHNSACQDMESPWRQFPDADMAREIWKAHVCPLVTSPPPRPAVLLHRAPAGHNVVYRPRQRGPPVCIPHRSVVKCCNGLFGHA